MRGKHYGAKHTEIFRITMHCTEQMRASHSPEPDSHLIRQSFYQNHTNQVKNSFHKHKKFITKNAPSTQMHKISLDFL